MIKSCQKRARPCRRASWAESGVEVSTRADAPSPKDGSGVPEAWGPSDIVSEGPEGDASDPVVDVSVEGGGFSSVTFPSSLLLLSRWIEMVSETVDNLRRNNLGSYTSFLMSFEAVHRGIGSPPPCWGLSSPDPAVGLDKMALENEAPILLWM